MRFPDFTERKEILIAVARKMTVSPTVNFDEIATRTGGFSGADLQALLYNAHLDVIHSSMSETPSISFGSVIDDTPIKYTTIGRSSAQEALSKAEETALQRRLRQIISKTTPTKNRAQPIKGIVRKKNELRQEHIVKSLNSTRPSVSVEERHRLEKIYREFISDRSGDLPIPPDGSGIGNRATLG